MRGMFLVAVCLIAAALCWGIYGPALEAGRLAMAGQDEGQLGTALVVLRPTILVGIGTTLASLLAAGLVLSLYGERGHWSLRGILWGLAAGTLAALGAVGTVVILALGGQAIYVMPILFGGVPVIGTLVTAALARRMKQIGAPLLAGVIVAVLGAVFLMASRPEALAGAEEQGIGVAHFLLVLVALTAVLFLWGGYAPLIHRSETRMGGSRWRPTLCVGVTFLALTVGLPALMLSVRAEPSQFTLPGMIWTLVAGVAFAAGGLATIAALASGGKPAYVMPLVVATAPLVNTFAATAGASGVERPGPLFLAGLILVIAGSAMVLTFAPRGSRRKAKASRKEPVKPQPSKEPATPPEGSASQTAE